MSSRPSDGPEAPSSSKAEQWERVIRKASRAIVVMRVCGVRSFEGSSPYYSYATGFVVDKTRGLILSNRHVVTTGPITAEAVFYNKEEVICTPIYRDPVHDFGFFRYNPEEVRFMDVGEISLAPDDARVGTEVRVVGNDAGEKLSILGGTISRLDRAAPYYGSDDYNDFNTFYIAAATSTSGGSSGSPVLNIMGNAIALNAGGKRSSASSFYLPLDRVKRALDIIRGGVQVPRGFMGCIMKHQPFDEVRRLGIPAETEQQIRSARPHETGMLVVSDVLPDGPSDGILQEGDVIIKIGDEYCTHFVPLEEVEDNTLAVVQSVRHALSAAAEGNYEPKASHILPDVQLDRMLARKDCSSKESDFPKPFVEPQLCTELDEAIATFPAQWLSKAVHQASKKLRALFAQRRRRQASGKLRSSYDVDAVNETNDTDDMDGWHDPYLDPTDGTTLPDPYAEVSLRPRGEALPVRIRTPRRSDTATGQYVAERKVVTLQDLRQIALQRENGAPPWGEPEIGSNEADPALFKPSLPISAHVSKALRALLHQLEAAGASIGKGEGNDELVNALAEAIAAVRPVVSVQVYRGDRVEQMLTHVGNLHGVLPHHFVEVSGSVIHPVSLQSARNYSLPVGGAYLSQGGYMFTRSGVPAHSVITAINGNSTPNPSTFAQLIAGFADGEQVLVRYFDVDDKYVERVAAVTVDRKWFGMTVYTRDDSTGKWVASRLEAAPPRKELEPSTTTLPRLKDDPIAELALACMVVVENHIPYLTDGLHSSAFMGVGVVVDRSMGLVLADRNTVPIGIGDVQLTFGGSVEIPAQILFLHPYHNFAILKYNPKLLSDTPVQELQLASTGGRLGQSYDFVGLNNDHQLVHHRAVVTKRERIMISDADPPRYRCYNQEALCFDRVADCIGGVFLQPQKDCDESGPQELIAFWASYSFQNANGKNAELVAGIPCDIVASVVNPLKQGEIPRLCSLDIELKPVPLSQARSAMGLKADQIAEVEAASNEQRQVLAVRRTLPGSQAANILKEGDLILKVRNKVVVSFGDVESALHELKNDVRPPPTKMFLDIAEKLSVGKLDDTLSVPLTILRDGHSMNLHMEPSAIDGRGISRVVVWAGMMLQAAHPAVLDKGYLPPEGKLTPYCSRWSYGSPAHKYGLRATTWITEINGYSLKSLDDLIEIVVTLGHHQSVRLRAVDLRGKERVYTLRTDLNYWPTVDMWRNRDGEWHRRHHEGICGTPAEELYAADASGATY